MKKFLFLLIYFVCLNLLEASSALDDANLSLKNSRKEYENLSAEISKKQNEYFDEIKSLEDEISRLQTNLKTLKSSTIDTSELARLVSKKAEDFELLRSRTNSNLSDYIKNKDFLGYSETSFFKDFSTLLTQSQIEIFSDKIFEKLVLKEEYESIKSDLKSGKSVTLNIDPTLGKLRSAKKSGIYQEIKAGGIWMYPILAFGFFALVIAIVKSFVVFGSKRLSKSLENNVSILANGTKENALKIANSAANPYKDLLVCFVENRNLESSLLEETAYEHMLSVGDKLYSGLGFLSVTAAVAPLLGLLGTVTGIIKTFSDLSIYGAGSPELMSGGISEALITTEYGLIVAIPAFIMNAVLSRRAKAILSDMEKISSSFLSKNKS